MDEDYHAVPSEWKTIHANFVDVKQQFDGEESRKHIPHPIQVPNGFGESESAGIEDGNLLLSL